VEISQLLSILNRPWMIELDAAHHWAGIAHEMIFNGKPLASVPTTDRRYYNGMYRVNPAGAVDGNGVIQVISVNGPIAKYDFCGTAGSKALQQAIRAANMDTSVLAIVLDIDSPGGQVDGTDNLAREIKASIKPVIAFVNGMMCSAAYWIGSAANEIIVDVANDGFNACIGSIGTIAMWKDYSKQEENAGIKTHIVTADASSDKNKLFQKANTGDYSDITKILNSLNDTFLAAVKANRGDKLSDKENVLTGKTYNGKEAIKYGLADRFGNFQQAVSRAYFLSKNNYKK
jgi:protease-4